MNDEIYPIEWLRRRDPLDAIPPTEFDSQQTLERIRSRIAVERRLRRQRRIVAGALGVVIASTATGVAAVVLTRTSPDPTGVSCYAAVDLSASRAVVAPDDDPLAACRAAWADPAFSEVFTTPTAQLAVCTLPSGVAAVFPADEGDPCTALGLTAGASPGPDDGTIRGIEQKLIDDVDGACVPIAELEQLATAELAKSGIDGWTARSTADASSDSCGSISIDGANHTIWIVPLPPMPPPAPATTNP